LTGCGQRLFWAIFHAKNNQFTKTGSGQTVEQLGKEGRFLQGKIKQADAILIYYPLSTTTNASTKKNDLDLYLLRSIF
jgi:hypothetical protein